MRVILVDDEWLALALLEKHLKEIEGVEVIGRYLDVNIALEQIAIDRPDIVFMDIEMPETNGLAAAEIVLEKSPETEIIFVTAHEQYALSAFNVQAFAYLLKPIAKHRLIKTLEFLRKRRGRSMEQPEMQQELKPKKVFLRCMGKLQFQKEAEEPVVIKWRTTKIKELFAYLLHNHHQVISKDILIQLLWPDTEEQKGITNLQTSIYRIRQVLKDLELDDVISVSYSQFGYILQFKGLLIDTEVWDCNLRQLPAISPETITLHQQQFEQYVGDYFGEDNYYWAEWECQRLKMLWLQHANDLAEYYLSVGKELEALSLYHRVVQHDPLLEESHFKIICLYDRLNERKSVAKHYQFMVSVLEKEAGVRPGSEIIDWYNKWKRSNEVAK